MGSSTSATPDPSTLGVGRGYQPNVNSPDPQQQSSAVPGPLTPTNVSAGANVTLTEPNGGVQIAATGGPGGTPNVKLGTAAASGAATTFVRDDDTIVAFDTTAPVTQNFNDVAATGSAAVAARRDHKHGMPASSTNVIIDAYETELTDTSLDQIIGATPGAGVVLVAVYFRVTVATTTVTIQVNWVDATGAQSVNLVNAVSEPVGSYSVMPLVIATAAANAITVKAQAGTANQVFVSASLVQL